MRQQEELGMREQAAEEERLWGRAAAAAAAYESSDEDSEEGGAMEEQEEEEESEEEQEAREGDGQQQQQQQRQQQQQARTGSEGQGRGIGPGPAGPSSWPGSAAGIPGAVPAGSTYGWGGVSQGGPGGGGGGGIQGTAVAGGGDGGGGGTAELEGGGDEDAQGAGPYVHISAEEQAEYASAFLDLMRQRFLTGQDAGVDYAAIDAGEWAGAGGCAGQCMGGFEWPVVGRVSGWEGELVCLARIRCQQASPWESSCAGTSRGPCCETRCVHLTLLAAPLALTWHMRLALTWQMWPHMRCCLYRRC